MEEAIAQGVDVVVMDLESSLERYPVPSGVSSFAVDATNPLSLRKAFSGIERNWGSMDAFVNLCGFVSETRPLSEFDYAEWQTTIAGNLTAAFLAANLAIPLLSKGSGGSLVNTTSGLAANTRPGFGAYAAAKAGGVVLWAPAHEAPELWGRVGEWQVFSGFQSPQLREMMYSPFLACHELVRNKALV